MAGYTPGKHLTNLLDLFGTMFSDKTNMFQYIPTYLKTKPSPNLKYPSERDLGLVLDLLILGPLFWGALGISLANRWLNYDKLPNETTVFGD